MKNFSLLLEIISHPWCYLVKSSNLSPLWRLTASLISNRASCVVSLWCLAVIERKRHFSWALIKYLFLDMSVYVWKFACRDQIESTVFKLYGILIIRACNLDIEFGILVQPLVLDQWSLRGLLYSVWSVAFWGCYFLCKETCKNKFI